MLRNTQHPMMRVDMPRSPLILAVERLENPTPRRLARLRLGWLARLWRWLRGTP